MSGFHKTNNIIRNNQVSADFGASGAGLYECNGIIRNNVIAYNVASDVVNGASGGGLSGCDGLIENNVIVGNVAEGAAGPNVVLLLDLHRRSSVHPPRGGSYRS